MSVAQPAEFLNAYHCGLLHPSVSHLPDKVSCSIHFWALMLLRTNKLLIIGVPQTIRGFFYPHYMASMLRGGGEISRQEQTEEISKDDERAYFQHRLPHSPFTELAGMSICIWQAGKWTERWHFYTGIRRYFFVVHKEVAQLFNFMRTKWMQLQILQVHL